jgi:hypothetical protein
MARSEQSLYEQAQELIGECGRYARLRALYLSACMRQAGELERAAVWRRVADLVSELELVKKARAVTGRLPVHGAAPRNRGARSNS